MDTHLFYQLRFIPVVLLLGIAAALLRRRGEPPVVLRALRRTLGGRTAEPPPAIPLWRRMAAFGCVLAALALALA
ncbi:MAG: hypothetical protein IKO72_04995 [Kiritimatiellae bacterium]|nr:hypothetical protein [Kiritimatiellia bacterium]